MVCTLKWSLIDPADAAAANYYSYTTSAPASNLSF